MAIPANTILIWTGAHISIPSGWVRETGLDDKFPKGWGVQNPNTTGGSNTHLHTAPTHGHSLDSHTHNVVLAHFIGPNNARNSGFCADNHGHVSGAIGGVIGGSLKDYVVTWASINHEPSYFTTIFIKPSSGGASLANGICAHWDKVDAPIGWGYCDGGGGTPDLRNKYLKGAGTGADAGVIGGDTFHGHTVTHGHTANSHTHSGASGLKDNAATREHGAGMDAATLDHRHTVTLNATTAVVNNYVKTDAGISDIVEPNYHKLSVIMNTGGGVEDWTEKYEANEIPTDATPAWILGGDITTEEISPTGYLHTVTTWPDSNPYYYLADANINDTIGVTLEGRLKVVSAVAELNQSFSLGLDGSANYVEMCIEEDNIYIPDWCVSEGLQTYVMDTTDDYHVYRLTLEGTALKIYVDGILRLQGTAILASAGKIFYFNSWGGMGEGWGTTEGYWDYVYSNTDGAFLPASPFKSQSPIGLIALWLGSTSAIPVGWYLCDGNNGTPDLRDKFLKVINNTSELGDTGGSNTHSHTPLTHTHTAIGTHTHTGSSGGPSESTSGNTGSDQYATSVHTHTLTSVSSTTPTYVNTDLDSDSVNNEPAYRTVAYIQLQKLAGGAPLLAQTI